MKISFSLFQITKTPANERGFLMLLSILVLIIKSKFRACNTTNLLDFYTLIVSISPSVVLPFIKQTIFCSLDIAPWFRWNLGRIIYS